MSPLPAISNHLEAHARFQPDAEALFDVESGRRFTWSQLHDLARRWTARLLSRGVQPGDRVAVLCGLREPAQRLLARCLALFLLFGLHLFLLLSTSSSPE